jgi:hypothetical protein
MVSQPTGEGAGRSIFDFAAAALTPSFALDRSFGGPGERLRTSIRVARQRAATAARRHGIRVQVDASAPGLSLVKIRSGRSVVAQSVLPIFHAGWQTLPVELTRAGTTLLRHHHRVHVTVTALSRDLLTSTATAGATGTLR